MEKDVKTETNDTQIKFNQNTFDYLKTPMITPLLLGSVYYHDTIILPHLVFLISVDPQTGNQYIFPVVPIVCGADKVRIGNLRLIGRAQGSFDTEADANAGTPTIKDDALENGEAQCRAWAQPQTFKCSNDTCDNGDTCTNAVVRVISIEDGGKANILPIEIVGGKYIVSVQQSMHVIVDVKCPCF